MEFNSGFKGLGYRKMRNYTNLKTLFDAHFTPLIRTHSFLQRILLFTIRVLAFKN